MVNLSLGASSWQITHRIRAFLGAQMEVFTPAHTRSSAFRLALIKGSLLNLLMPAFCPQEAVRYKPCTLLLEENADACLVVGSL